MQKILTTIKKPLLLSPAGSPYKAKVAFEYGTDAVYCGTAEFGLRASDGYKTIEQIDNTIKKAHTMHKKVYITVNSSIHQADSANFKSHIQSLINCNPDAFILSDPAVIEIIHSIINHTTYDKDNSKFNGGIRKENYHNNHNTDNRKDVSNNKNRVFVIENNTIGKFVNNTHKINNQIIDTNHHKSTFPELHLSTQANVTNSISASFWYNQGIQQITFARELSLEEIFSIKNDLENQNIPLKIETFVHGAMCISYSGRCLLSLYMTNPDLSTPNGSVNRDANRGECVHPCRWQYKVAYLTEKERSDETFELIEDDQSSYIMSSKDLCMIQYIPILMLAGIDSFKIEGRMKSSLYTAATTYVYRKAIDYAYTLLVEENKRFTEDIKLKYIQQPEAFFKDFQDWLPFVQSLTHYLELFSHRPYTTGFYFPNISTIQSSQTASSNDSLRESALSSSQNIYLGDFQLVGESIDNAIFMCKNKFIPHKQQLILFSLDGLQTIENYSITDEQGNIPSYLQHSNKYIINCIVISNLTKGLTKVKIYDKKAFYFLLTKK